MAGSRGAVRHQGIDLLRIVAAFAVVAFHAGLQPREAFYGGLIVFLALSPMYEMGANLSRRRSSGELATTFLVPLAFWFPVYGVVNLARGRPFVPDNGLLGILAGPSIHLWFLPFMFAVLVVLNQLKHEQWRVPLFACAIVAMPGLAATSPLWSDSDWLSRAPLGQWVHASAAVCAGAAIGLSQGSARMMATTVVAIAATLVLLWTQADPLFSPLAYTLGLPALLVARFAPVRWPAGFDVTPLAACMMGVYLMHPLALGAFGAILGKGTAFAAIAAFISCTIATYVWREVRHALRPAAPAQPRPAGT